MPSSTRLPSTTLASSDAEAVCAVLRASEAIPRELSQTLAARVRLAADTRTLAQRNDDALRAVAGALPLTWPIPELVDQVRRRMVRRLEALGLDRMPSDRTLKRGVQRIAADKTRGMSTGDSEREPD